ncbi:MAG: hypothetical protein ACRDZ2_05030 [Ilumatobacteraceae bacterium]
MFDELPPFMKVPEAGKVLRVGRSKAYDLTVEWERTGGRSGLAFVWCGSQKRVPRGALVRFAERALQDPPAA